VLQHITRILNIFRQLGKEEVAMARCRRKGFNLLDRVIRLMLASDQRKDIGAVELLPDLIKRFGAMFLHPSLGLPREVQRGCHPVLVEQGRGLMTNTPDALDWELREVVVEFPAGDRR